MFSSFPSIERLYVDPCKWRMRFLLLQKGCAVIICLLRYYVQHIRNQNDVEASTIAIMMLRALWCSINVKWVSWIGRRRLWVWWSLPDMVMLSIPVTRDSSSLPVLLLKLPVPSFVYGYKRTKANGGQTLFLWANSQLFASISGAEVWVGLLLLLWPLCYRS